MVPATVNTLSDTVAADAVAVAAEGIDSLLFSKLNVRISVIGY